MRAKLSTMPRAKRPGHRRHPGADAPTRQPHHPPAEMASPSLDARPRNPLVRRLQVLQLDSPRIGQVSRAEVLRAANDGKGKGGNILAVARAYGRERPPLRRDILAAVEVETTSEDRLLNSLCQFDLWWCVIADLNSEGEKSEFEFYPNFAVFCSTGTGLGLPSTSSQPTVRRVRQSSLVRRRRPLHPHCRGSWRLLVASLGIRGFIPRSSFRSTLKISSTVPKSNS